MFAIVAFIFALIGIIALLYFKNWEIARGRMVFVDFRKKADTFVIESITSFKSRLPRASKQILKHVINNIIYYTSTILLKFVKWLEKKLVRFSNMIKGRVEIQNRGEASMYLQNVSAHKNNLKENNSNNIA